MGRPHYTSPTAAGMSSAGFVPLRLRQPSQHYMALAPRHSGGVLWHQRQCQSRCAIRFRIAKSLALLFLGVLRPEVRHVVCRCRTILALKPYGACREQASIHPFTGFVLRTPRRVSPWKPMLSMVRLRDFCGLPTRLRPALTTHSWTTSSAGSFGSCLEP